MTASFDPLEKRILRWLLIEAYGERSAFLGHLAALRRTTRTMTGVGYYLDLDADPQVKPVDNVNDELSSGFDTRLPEPHLVGFTLFIRDGRLSSFEGYTFGDVPWPSGPMADWLIFDTAQAVSQRAK